VAGHLIRGGQTTPLAWGWLWPSHGPWGWFGHPYWANFYFYFYLVWALVGGGPATPKSHRVALATLDQPVATGVVRPPKYNDFFFFFSLCLGGGWTTLNGHRWLWPAGLGWLQPPTGQRWWSGYPLWGGQPPLVF
jgi:hypothetical protein